MRIGTCRMLHWNTDAHLYFFRLSIDTLGLWLWLITPITINTEHYLRVLWFLLTFLVGTMLKNYTQYSTCNIQFRDLLVVRGLVYVFFRGGHVNETTATLCSLTREESVFFLGLGPRCFWVQSPPPKYFSLLVQVVSNPSRSHHYGSAVSES